MQLIGRLPSGALLSSLVLLTVATALPYPAAPAAHLTQLVSLLNAYGRINATGEFNDVPTLVDNRSGVVPVHVLLIGDSIDRYITEAVCKLENLRRPSAWAARDGLRYLVPFRLFRGQPTRMKGCAYDDTPKEQGSRLCRSPKWGSLAMLHTFGAALRGPYPQYHKNVNVRGSSGYVADTELRIRRGLRLYRKVMGVYPTLVIYGVSCIVRVMKCSIAVGRNAVTQGTALGALSPECCNTRDCLCSTLRTGQLVGLARFPWHGRRSFAGENAR